VREKQDLIVLDEQPLRHGEVDRIAAGDMRLELGPNARARLVNGRAVVDRIIALGQRAYGINTGLGALSDVVLQPGDLAKLARNTLLSHACGMGEPLARNQVRAVMTALANDLCHGHSGVSPAVVDQLVACLNAGVTPVVPSQGSVGYIVHGAHVGLTLIGVGEAEFGNVRMPAAAALDKAGLKPITLAAKDGLCLVNGTRDLTGLACIALAEAERVTDWADAVAAMSFEALKGQTDCIDADLLALKPYPGLLQTGANLRRMLEGSAILAAAKGIRTQDALSIRSIPQIHGASRDQIAHVREQVNTELRSSSDNPLVLGTPNSYRVISNAHPHGQSLAIAMDLLAIAIAELGAAAERRLDRLVNPLVNGLPPFLVEKSGVNSGMMIAQYAAASIASENRILAQPAVLDSVVTSGLQEDDVNLGVPAALKCAKVIENVTRILAIELILAAQALEFHGEKARGRGTDHLHRRIRQRVPRYAEDRFLAPDLAQAEAFLKDRNEAEGLRVAVGAFS